MRSRRGRHDANTNDVLIGLVVEAATGQTIGDKPRARVLELHARGNISPIGGGVLPEGTVHGYQPIEGRLADVSASNLSWVWIAGGMVSTTPDLAR
jgi:D-alanyl-D-alanine carboxypeptidase